MSDTIAWHSIWLDKVLLCVIQFSYLPGIMTQDLYLKESLLIIYKVIEITSKSDVPCVTNTTRSSSAWFGDWWKFEAILVKSHDQWNLISLIQLETSRPTSSVRVKSVAKYRLKVVHLRVNRVAFNSPLSIHNLIKTYSSSTVLLVSMVNECNHIPSIDYSHGNISGIMSAQ